MRPEASTDDPRNVLLLRSDLHSLFNARKFTIVPKGKAWVAHVLAGRPDTELAALYHNVELLRLVDLSIECIFARFAWAILAQGLLVRAGMDRRLVVVEAGSNTAVVKNVSGNQCSLQFEPQLPGGRSPSPTKRQRGVGDVAEDSDDEDEDDVDDDDDDDDDIGVDDNDDDVGVDDDDDDSIWSRRGRQRKRWRSLSVRSSVESLAEGASCSRTTEVNEDSAKTET